ncbi:hypothetical protein NQ314_014422 [Rhamnusium bicolor]|uniref:Tetraspanin n=1 Tax=Rhamnusium bicolor TaxID=1586634 RepID=A0AAV8X425_9CUCU|nr:hypothetical protein NQ314_014422 [Rhamnusium bicolor]
MRTCELSLIKYILFIFNVIFAISGIGLIVAGSIVLSDVGEFSHFMDSKILDSPVVLIVAGVIVFLVASLGCYGAIRESYYMLMALECCGVDGPIDWDKKRPLTCCHALRENVPGPTAENCRNAKEGDEFLYNYGCFDELQKKAENASKVLVGVGIGVAFIEIIGIILACWLASAVKNKD